jgi:hypothetical protein
MFASMFTIARRALGRDSALRGGIPATSLETGMRSLITRNNFPARLLGNFAHKRLKPHENFSTESGRIERFPVIFPDSRESAPPETGSL